MNTTTRSYANLTSAVLLVNLAWILPVLSFAGLIAAGIGLTAYKAKVLADMWLWFAVPAGFKPLSFVQSIGIITIISFLTVNPLAATRKDEKDGTSSKMRGLNNMIFMSIWVSLCWGAAYCWHWYLG